MTDSSLPSTPAWGDGAPAVAGDQIFVACAGPAPQNRLTVLLRWILVIPHSIVLSVITIVAEVVLLVSWFAALILGRLPEGMAGFLAGYLRWNTRVYAYQFLLTDRYPPFAFGDADYPLRLALRPGRLNRATVLFRGILAIPAGIIAATVSCGAGTIMSFITWLIVLISGRMPAALHQAYAATLRYMARTIAYVFLLTGTYPAGLFGDAPADGAAPGEGPAGVFPSSAPSGSWESGGMAAPPDAGFTPGSWEGPAATDPESVQAPGFAGRWTPPAAGEPAAGGPAAGEWAMPAEGQHPFPPPSGAFPPPSGAMAVAPAPAPSWRLVLPAASKRLMVVFLVLGVAFYGAYIALLAVLGSSVNGTVQSANAAAQIQAAHSQLLVAINQFDAKVHGCNSSLSCVTNADAQAATAIGTFGQQLRSVPVPSAASAADHRLASVTSQAQAAFQKLAASTSAAQYQQTVVSTHVQAVLNNFDTDYQRLMTSLGS